MKAEITSFVQTCHGCQSAKPSKQNNAHAGIFEVPDTRFLHCHVDIVGPMPESEGYKYLFTMVDRNTRFLFAVPIKEPSAKACADAFLLNYVAMVGLPSCLTSDNGTALTSGTRVSIP